MGRGNKKKSRNNKSKKSVKTLTEKYEKDSIDLGKELPIYVQGMKKNEEKINGYANRRQIAKNEINSLKSKFNEFYSRTVGRNSGYFGPQFIGLTEKLKENIDKLQVKTSFSNSFLKWYNNLKEARHDAKNYIKKIDSAFEEAKKNKNSDPTSSNVNYQIKSLLDLESVSGKDLNTEKKDLLYFISEVTELKEKISNYHPITREMENLSLAKSCESFWKEYVEISRRLTELKIKTESNPSEIKPEDENEGILEDLSNQRIESKDNYDSAFDCLKTSLENKKTINPSELPKEIQKTLEKIFKYWNEEKINLKKFDDIQYQGEFSSKLKKGIKKGRNFFGDLVKKVTGFQSDIDKTRSLLLRYGIMEN